MPAPHLSIVIPVYNEEDNLKALTAELEEVLRSLNLPWEIIFVDDGSTDGSPAVLAALAGGSIRVLKLGRNCGQTAAFDAGFHAARGEVVVTMDADMQNDPNDIPLLLHTLQGCDLACGWRRERNDSFLRRVSSRIANAVRNRLSGENIRDVGCSLKAFRRGYVRDIKLYTGLHRFFPTLVKMEGGRVEEVPVSHRPRRRGSSKYNIRNRMVRSFIDLLAVCWMKNRKFHYDCEELKETLS